MTICSTIFSDSEAIALIQELFCGKIPEIFSSCEAPKKMVAFS
ncbi:hypothetical protein [Hydrocoleum sp. CS-953]|nr:hypothetical protein [Hydrocoleum sp. CS-953]